MLTTKTAARVLTLSSVVQILGYILALASHIGDPTWSPHAQFHLILGDFWIAGLDILIIVLSWIPLQKQERWSFWAALVGFSFAQTGHFLSMLLLWEGRPPVAWESMTLGLNAGIGFFALWIFWRVIFTKNQPGLSNK